MSVNEKKKPTKMLTTAETAKTKEEIKIFMTFPVFRSY